MLPKKYRLKNNSAFKATYNIRNISSDGFFTVFAGKKKKDADTPTRIGFVVSKKNHKRAVKRNRIKRLMRESVRVGLKENSFENLNEYMSIIVVAKSNAIGQDYQTVNSSITRLINKLRLPEK